MALSQHREELQELWKAAFESNPTMYFILDAAGKVVSVNIFGAQQLGYDVDELLGQPVLNVFYGPDRDAVQKHARECFEHPGQTLRWEARKIRKDGSMLWVRETANAVSLKERPVLLVVCEDITEQKRAEEAARRSEKELRDLIQTMPTMAFSTLPDGTNGWVNPRWVEFSGFSSQQTSGHGWQSALHPDDLDEHVTKWQRSLATGEPFENEARHRSAQGEYRWFLVRAVPLRDDNGTILTWYGTLTDIEDRKRAETLLRGERRILEMVAKGDPLPRILDSLCQLVEEHAHDVLASVLLIEDGRLKHGGAPSLPKAYIEAIDGLTIGPSVGSCGTAAYLRKQVIVSDIATDPLWADYRDAALPYSLRACWSTPIMSSDSTVIATFAMYYREPRNPSPRDQEIIEQITHLAGIAIQRKLTEQKLQRSEAYLAEAHRLTHTGSWARDSKSPNMLYCSDEMLRIFGFDPQERLPTSEGFLERVVPEDRERVRKALTEAFRRKADFTEAFKIALPDGATKYVDVIGHPVLDGSGAVIEFVGTAVDVTAHKLAEQERRRAEEELRASEARFRTFVDHATDAFMLHDDTGVIIDVNRQACERLGYSRDELIGMAPAQFDVDLDAAHARRVRERLNAEEVVSFETRLRRKDGSLLPVEVRVREFRRDGRRFALSLTQDISERKRAEQERERLRQVEADLAHMNRVSIMGELTASVAHEIKQPMTAAVANANACARWLRRDVPDLKEAGAAASRMVDDMLRAADIIDRVRSLYSRAAPERERVDVNEIIREMSILLADTASRNGISIRTQFDVDVSSTTADRVQLQQVLMNLMLNAIDAMKGTGGELIVASTKTEDGQLAVAVSDSGTGLPVDESERMFEAFFTTKPHGTGMGLSISRRIIESHGGRLWASRNAGPGATFQFTLPVEVTSSAA